MFDDFKIQMSKIWSKLTLFGFKACMVTAIVPEQCCWLYPLGEFEKNHWVQSISHILIISNVTLHKVALGVGSMSLFLLKRHISVRNFEVLISEASKEGLYENLISSEVSTGCFLILDIWRANVTKWGLTDFICV